MMVYINIIKSSLDHCEGSRIFYII